MPPLPFENAKVHPHPHGCVGGFQNRAANTAHGQTTSTADLCTGWWKLPFSKKQRKNEKLNEESTKGKHF